MIDYALLVQSFPKLLQGALTTIQLAAYSCLLGLGLGTAAALAQTSTIKPLRWLITLYVTLIRGTPMLIQIAFMYYAILPVLGINASPFCAFIIAIGINSGAYVSQIIRTGISSVSIGQLEAAQTLGFSKLQIMRYILLPQALRLVLPALGNEFVTLIKDSSLASTIGVVELYKEGTTIISQTYDAITIYTGIALTYLLLTTTLSFGINYLEKVLRSHAHH